MQAKGRTIYIVGAGIAGLTLALSLAKFGISVVVLEKQSAIEQQGAGIQLSPNARHILNQLGLENALNKVACSPEALDIYPFRDEKPIKSLTLGDAALQKFGARYDVIHRADLAEVLHKACRRFANIDIQFQISNIDMETHARGASILFEDAAKQNRNARPFAIVGADGVHSDIRRNTLGEADAAYSGMVAWRSMVPFDALFGVVDKTHISVLWGPGFHAVLYPIPSRKSFNVALFTKAKRGDIENGTLQDTPKLPRRLMQSPRFEAILENAANGWTFWPLYSVTAKNWHHGTVGLIGDAAHAMLPFQAQGAAMAIEDAAALAPLLATEADAANAFSIYQNERKPRVSKVAKISRHNGVIFHFDWPLTMPRNAFVALQSQTSHFDRLAWLYGYKPSTIAQSTSPTV